MSYILTLMVGAWFGYIVKALLTRSAAQTKPVELGLYHLNAKGEIELESVVALGQLADVIVGQDAVL